MRSSENYRLALRIKAVIGLFRHGMNASLKRMLDEGSTVSMDRFLEKVFIVFPRWLALSAITLVVGGGLAITIFAHQPLVGSENRLADACAVASWAGLSLWLFFLPTEIAFDRKHRNLTAVVVLNASLLVVEVIAILAFLAAVFPLSAACSIGAVAAWLATLVWSLSAPPTATPVG